MIQNEAGMTQEHSRICLKVMLVLKQPSKVNVWTSKLIFECFRARFWISILHNSSMKVQLLDLKPVSCGRWDENSDWKWHL